jgi:glycerol-3-phosphate dehydrogenase
MKKFSFRERKDNLRDLETQNLDVLIIGGGINGAGVARDASLRGLKVGLIEARDFASGTSSRSSKLIHGGI